MSDDPFEEEDAVYEERVRQRREEGLRPWRAREGLVRLGSRPVAVVFDAFRRSLPSLSDAERLFDLVEARLGARAVRDPWATPRERCLLLRDAERPDWYLPRRLLYLAVDVARPDPIPMHIDIPERIKRITARRKAKEPPPEEPEAPAVVPLSPRGKPGRLGIHEGAAYADITFDARGAFQEWTVTLGDGFASSQRDTEPFILDPFARPPQTPPLSLFLRDELLAEGVPVDVLADLVLTLRPDTADRGRAFVPVVQPGNVIGAWDRGLYLLRAAEWEGRLGDEGGWVVIDAWSGIAIATGPTLDDAFAAWREQVRRVQPLPPVERPATPPPQEPEVPEAPAATPPEGVAVASTGMIRIEFRPPVVMEWPEPRPENVPAIATPVPPLAPIPEALARAGFSRTLRFFGEHGEVAHGFVREEDGGFTLVGDDAASALDLTTLEADIARIDAKSRADYVDYFGHGSPYDKPRYPVLVTRYRVWDDTGRVPGLRDGGTSWQAELAPRAWDLGQRHLVTRVRYLQVG